MKRRIKKRIHINKTYRTYLLTYLVVLLVPLLTMVYGYLYSSRTIGQESYNYHFNLLKQTRQAYDQTISLIRSELEILALDKQVNLLMRTREWQTENMFDVLELKNTLGNIKFNTKVCDNIGVFFHKNRNLVTNYRRYPNQLMFLYTDGLAVSEEDFLSGINLAKMDGYFIIGSSPENLRMIFYRNVYGVSFRDVYATVMISIPWRGIAEAAENITLSEEGGVFLINAENRIIGNSNPSVDISPVRYEELTDDQVLMQAEIRDRTYMVSFLNSEKSDLKYVIYTPKKVFYAKVNYLYYAVVAEVVLCLIIGIGLAVYFARETFNPIQEMLDLLDGKKRENLGDRNAATYERLEASLRGMLSEKLSMEKQLERSAASLQNGVLVGAMKGMGWSGENLENYFLQLQEKWESQDYRIILFKLDHLEQCKLFEGQTQEEQLSTWPLVMFTIRNVLEELLLAEEEGTVVEIENMAACILNISSEWNDAELENRIRKCITFYKEAFELVTYASVSGIHQGAEEISLAYEEAYEAIAHKSFWGSEVADIILYDNEMLAEETGSQQKIVEMERKLLNCLSARDYKKASELLDEIIEQGMKKDMRYLSYNQCCASGIVSMLIGMFEELSGEKEDDFYQNLMASERLLKAASVAVLKSEVHQIFDEITSYYEKRNQKEQPSWIAEAERYLQENYRDPNINISAIAETFGMSLSYMGRTFKRYTGEGMLDQIHVLRLQNCKELLDQGKTVKEAAETAGYIDSKAMIRAFKRYEGITPGQYKRQGNLPGSLPGALPPAGE